MWYPCVTSTTCVMPAGLSSSIVRAAFSRVSRDSLSSHLSGRPNSSAAILPATRASVGAPVWPQPEPPLKAIGAPVWPPSQTP